MRHELLECSKNNQVGESLLSCLQTYLPNLSPDTLLRLEFHNLDSTMELATTLLTAVTFSVIWKERQASSRVQTAHNKAGKFFNNT